MASERKMHLGWRFFAAVAENDFDSNGLALLDEFSDDICNCVTEGLDGDIKVASVTEI